MGDPCVQTMHVDTDIVGEPSVHTTQVRLRLSLLGRLVDKLRMFTRPTVHSIDKKEFVKQSRVSLPQRNKKNKQK